MVTDENISRVKQPYFKILRIDSSPNYIKVFSYIIFIQTK